MQTKNTTLPELIKRRIRAKGRGWVFTPKDFIDLGSRLALDTALSRMATDGYVKRLSHGLYYFPKISPIFGEVMPDSDSIAETLARKTGDLVFSGGAEAANLLGLTTQVPARLEYYTTGKAKTYTFANRKIFLLSSPVSLGVEISSVVRLVVHALIYIGRNGINETIVSKLSKLLKQKDKRQLLSVMHILPSWLAPNLKLIAA